MTSASVVPPAIDVDVVIIGGGIQGLWLLGDLLDNNYRAILLERLRPGFGQTGHSHVFLHEGHMFASGPKERRNEIVEQVEIVREANQLWRTALGTGRLSNLTQLKDNFYVGWMDPQKASNFEAACSLANIPCEEVVIRPSEFGNMPMITKFYKSEGICLESKALLDHLLNQGDLRKRVGYCREINVETYDSGKFDLSIRCAKENPLKIRAAALVLSAGAGNERLAKRLFANVDLEIDLDATRQQTVKTFMLVIKDLKGSLKPASGMFQEFRGIFIVPRQDSQGRTTLLIGNGERRLVPFPGEMTAFDAAAWFGSIKTDLEKLLPAITDNPDDYEWGIYEATKAEPWTVSKRFEDGGAFPRSYHVHKEPKAPLWLTWPTLLTFAPKVAKSIAAELMNVVQPALLLTDWALWDNFCESLTPVEDRWKITQLLRWTDFKRCFTC